MARRSLFATAGFAWPLAAGLALASLAALLGGLGWPFELFSHFRIQLCAACVAGGVWLLALRAHWPALLLFALATLHGLALWPGRATALDSAICPGPTLEVISVNLQFRNSDTEPLFDWLRKSTPDLVAAQEVSPFWAAAFARGLPELAKGASRPRTDAYGIALLGTRPFEFVEALDLAGDGRPSLHGRVLVGDSALEVLAMHARWPITPSLHASRNAALDAAAVRARAAAGPVVMIGDLNLTPHSPDFARLLERSGLRDAAAGRIWQPTWMAGFWPLALRIDHVLVSPGICVESVEVGPPIGSDHRPLRVRLRLPAAASLRAERLAGRRRELAATLGEPAAEAHDLRQYEVSGRGDEVVP
jgi:endonuclease/exonuclease/phosphatase (EEP) superfamily protein YafD